MTTRKTILDFIESKGFTTAEAEKIFSVYKRARAVIDRGAHDGWTFTHGAFGDVEPMRNALTKSSEVSL